jgi:hypothetical protein
MILAAHPDATVVVRADYFFPGDSSLPPGPRRLEPVSQPAPSRPAPVSSHLNPIQLYARTQRGLDDKPKAALLDVHA